MRRHKLFIFLFAVLAACAQPLLAQADTNVYPVNLSGHGYLKDVFDAGLRPKRYLSLLDQCEVEDKIISFEMADGHFVIIPVERCEFKVRSSNQALREITAQSIALTPEETKHWMTPICQNFNRPGQELNAFLEKVIKGHRQFGWVGDDELEGFGVGTPRPERESGLPYIAVRLASNRGSKSHPIFIMLTIYWERPPSELDYPRTPLSAPKGYEVFSLEVDDAGPPYVAEWIRKGKPAPPDVEQKLGAAGIQRLRDEYATKTGIKNTPLSPEPQEALAAPATTVPETPASKRSKWWLGLVILPLAFGGWWLLRRKRSEH